MKCVVMDTLDIFCVIMSYCCKNFPPHLNSISKLLQNRSSFVEDMT